VKMREIVYPFSEAAVRELRAGEAVLVSGLVFTGRDRLHKHLAEGGVAPVSLRDGAIYHCGPVAVPEGSGWRVVAAEMPASFEPEALKAQAVAARTFACSRMERITEHHPDAPLCTDSTCCQAYIDPEAAAVNWGKDADAFARKIADAIADTDGLVLFYHGQPIEAVFHSSSAGRTLDAVEVWGRQVPYLTGVDSPEGEDVPNYHTSAVFAPEEFKRVFLTRYPEARFTDHPADWFGEVTHSSNGGVTALTVGGITVSGATMRSLYCLRSASFSIAADQTAVTFSVTGYGHGVGMSQYGANTLARQGKTCAEILSWYYTGVTLGQYP